MEHIFSVAISMDDDRIKEAVASKAEKEIISNLQREVGRVIFAKYDYCYHNSPSAREKGYDEKCLSDWAKNQFQQFIEGHKDEIIAEAARELAAKLARTKAAKAILENLDVQND